MPLLLRRLLLVASGAVAAAAPWFYSTSDDGFVGPVVLMGSGLLVLLGLLLFWQPRLFKSRGVVLAGALLAWMVLTTWCSACPFHSQRLLASWVTGFAVLFGLVWSRPSAREIRQVTLAIVTSSAALSLAALLQAHQAGLHGERLHGTFANSDCFAALLMMALALGVALLPLSRSWQNGLLAVDLATLFTGLLVTGARAATVAAALAVVLVVVRRIKMARQHRLRLAVVAVAVLLAVAAAGWAMVGHVAAARFAQAVQSSGAESWSVRELVLQGFLPTMQRSPWLGFGPGTFSRVFQADRPHGLFTGFINEAHIDLVQVAVENGWVGLGLFLLLTMTAVVVSWRSRSAPSAIGAAVGIIGLLLYSTVNFAVPVPADLVWLLGLCGLAFAYAPTESGRPARRAEACQGHALPSPVPPERRVCLAHIVRVIGPLVLTTAAIWQVQVGWCAVQAQRLASSEPESASLATVIRSSELVDLEPGCATPYLQRSAILEALGTRLGAFSLIKSAEDDALYATRLDPDGKSVRLQAAPLLEKWGRIEEGETMLREAALDYPMDPRPWAELAHLAELRGERQTAAELLWRSCWASNGGDGLNPLAHTIGAVEAQTPGEGCRLLRKWSHDTPEAGPLLAQIALNAGVYAGIVDIPDQSALALAQTAAHLNPAEPDACLTCARLLLRTGDAKGARQALQHASDLTGKPVTELAPATVIAAALDRAHSAAGVKLLRNCLNLTADDTDARQELARLYLLQQDAPEARRIYQDALGRDPDSAVLHEQMADLEAQLGDFRDAYREYQDAARLSPTNDRYQQSLQRFEQIHPAQNETGHTLP